MKTLAWAALAGALAAPLAAQEASTQAARPIDLPEAFQLALRRSETIAQSSDSVAEALARMDELKSAILPHLALNAQQTFQENPNLSNLSSLNQASLTQAQFTLTQPLFSGLREFLAYKAGRLKVRSSQLDEKRAESLLYQDVAQAYLDLLRQKRESGIRASLIGVLQDRIRQLGEWIRIGRARSSEVLASRSQLAQTEAQLEIANGEERVSQEALKFLTGLSEDLDPREIPAPAVGALGDYLNQARSRSDVEARREDLEAARFLTEIFRRQRWPTLGLTDDYYLERPGFLSAVHWDAAFSASLPLFTGGQIEAQVREAASGEDAVRQALSLAERSAQREVRTAYQSLGWTLKAESALEKAAELAQANVQAQTEDYRLGLVTNLDVLDSLTALETARLNLNQTRAQALLANIQLQVAAGGPP